jgi:bacterioferritin (cytochrome b1)
VKECALKSDSISRQLFEEFVIDEERHADRFGAEIKSIQDMEDSYLAIC